MTMKRILFILTLVFAGVLQAETLFEMPINAEALQRFDRWKQKAAQLETASDGDCYHFLRKGSLVVPVDAKNLAGKDLEFSMEFKTEGIPDTPDGINPGTYGFRLFISARMEDGSSSGLLQLGPWRGTNDWKVHTRKLPKTLPQNTTALSLDIGIPAGHAWLRSLKILSVEPKAPQKADLLAPATPTLIRLGKMSVPPTLDGRINKAEWSLAASFFGGRSSVNGLMTKRLTAFYFGYDDQYAYAAFLSEIPNAPILLDEDEQVEVTLLPPGADKPHSFHLDSKGVGNLPQGARFANGLHQENMPHGFPCWEVEIAIPLSALNASIVDGQPWGLQLKRRYQNPVEDSCWHLPAKPGELGTFIPDSSAPAVSVLNFGACATWRTSANYAFNFMAASNAAQPVTVTSKSVSFVASGYSKLDSLEVKDDTKISRKNLDAALSPKAGEPAYKTHLVYNLWPGKINALQLRFVDGDKVLYQRDLAWDLAKTLDWKDDQGRPDLKAAFYPSYGNLLLLNMLNGKQRDLLKAEITVKDQNGKVWATITPEKSGECFTSWEGRINLPAELPIGKYTVELTTQNKAGKTFTCPRTFAVQSFPWQNTNIGRERIIVPPFKPLKCQGSRVDALQTGYQAGGLFFDQVYALGENILAEPVGLYINGELFQAVGAPKVVSAEPDRVVMETQGKWQNLDLKVTLDYDYDGFCYATLHFTPQAGSVKIDSLKLCIALKNHVVSLFETRLFTPKTRAVGEQPRGLPPDKQGIIWSTKDYEELLGKKTAAFPELFQTYFWFGGIYQGFSWMLDKGHRYFSFAPGQATQTVERQGDKVVFTVNMVNKPVTWNGDVEIGMGFQPSPVKPIAKEFYRTAEHMYDYKRPRSAEGANVIASPLILSSLLYPIPTFPNGDSSFYKYVIDHQGQETIDHKDFAKVLDEFLARNRQFFEENGLSVSSYKASMGIRWRYTGMKNLGSYMNPTLITCYWPEWEMYKSEWQQFDYPEENMMNEYMCSLTDSRIDKLLYDGRNLVRMGVRGINYDCFDMGTGAFNTVTSHAYKPFDKVIATPNGLMRWRQIIKRTAHMLYTEGKLVNGRPWVDLHATMFVPLPVASFATSITTWERGGNGGDFQERFPESTILANTIGTQAGVYPVPIVSTRAGDMPRRERELKSLMSTMCSFGILHIMDQFLLYRQWFDDAWNLIFDFGFGKPDVEMFFTWEKQPVTTTAPHVRMTVLKRKDGKVLLLIGNLGEACFAPLDCSGLGYTKWTLRNAENQALLMDNTVPLERHGYALILVEK